MHLAQFSTTFFVRFARVGIINSNHISDETLEKFFCCLIFFMQALLFNLVDS
jgi:hypothetical protein